MFALNVAFWSYAFGTLMGFLLYRKDNAAAQISFGAAIVGGASGTVAAIWYLLGMGGETSSFQLMPSLVPNLDYTIRPDPLGAFFVLIVSAVGLAMSIYSPGYVKSYFGRKSVGVMGGFYNLLLLSTTLLFLAGNAFFFLISWELMAATSYLLITFEHENKEARRAGVLYFIMSHIGTGCLILGFLLLFQNVDSYSFDQMHNSARDLSNGQRNAAFILFLIGFGVKAGIVPLHIWLPAAHPAAPSNVSALLSGVIIKCGIYGIARVCFDLLGTPPLWWGILILVMGTVSALLGVLYALMEHDIKRLLAFHSIENIGIIWMGLGTSLIFINTQHPMLAGLALIAGLYHTINHATFKGLLFLGAGAVVHATHTRNMEEMGGLARRMPKTALFFLIGAIAISALPPLNGFVSEWLTYQSLLHGFDTTVRLERLLFPIAASLLALTGALAAACFVKAFGITFLAQPRSDHARDARETTPSMLAGMAILAAACFFLGLFPSQIIRLFDPLTIQFTGTALSPILTPDNLLLGSMLENSETISTLGMVVAFVCLLPVPLALWWCFGRHTTRHIGPTWDCGLRGLTPRMEYSATGFSKPLRMIFKGIFRPRRAVISDYEFSKYFTTTIRFETRIEETFEKRVYRPLQSLILNTSRRMRTLQAGSLQAYLIYIFVTLVALLIVTL